MSAQNMVASGYQAAEARPFVTQSGANGVSFPILVNEYQGKDREDRLTRFEVVLWGKYATAMEKSLVRGENGKFKAFTIVGKMVEDQPYQRNDGSHGRTLKINASTIAFGGTGLNILNITGRVGYDAELRYTQSGTAVTSTSIYVNEYAGKNPDGTTKYRSLKFKVTVWGKRAENMVKVLKKGAIATAVGSAISSDPYTNDKGETHCSLDMWANEVSVMAASSQQSNSQQQEPVDPMDEFGFDDLLGELGGEKRQKEPASANGAAAQDSSYTAAAQDLDDIPF